MVRKFKRLRRRRGPLPFRHVFVLSFFIFAVLTVQGLWIVEKGIEPTLMRYAETKTRQIAEKAINDAISKKVVSEDMDMSELIITHRIEGSDQVGFSFNQQVNNRILSEATNRVQKHLDLIEEGNLDELKAFLESEDLELEFEETESGTGLIYWIPLGAATNNALLSNLGPLVPIRFQFIGDVQSGMETKATSVGINNTYLEVLLNLSVDVNLVLPFSTKTAPISTTVRVGDLFLPGKVPDVYYQGQGGTAPPPSIKVN
ncbi:sporulation protein YunB [Bacillus taeanensis]|uniref:Sporulation protein YunB n=1 Tax=Bacillus taeanensis TaxID=273032 RepID=A0A366XZC2_9BACI|nr:sporulation protein YunB [Bacillus taeanensis]RBW71277.1 sporulation protein YunB [Bacillus taeanensis]